MVVTGTCGVVDVCERDEGTADLYHLGIYHGAPIAGPRGILEVSVELSWHGVPN